MSHYLRLLLIGFIFLMLSNICFSELLELEDTQLATYRGQAAANVDSKESVFLNQTQSNNSSGISPANAPVNTATNISAPSAGITIDINLQLYIDEIRWVDSDGVGQNGTQGAVIMKGFSMGSLGNNIAGPASIRGVTFDVDGNNGLAMGVQRIGGPGEGIDVKIDSIQIR